MGNEKDEEEEGGGATNKRFAFTTSPNVDELKRKHVPKNTDKCTQWALRCFSEWKNSRVETVGKGPADDILSSNNADEVCYWLCRFFTEVRKSNGSRYCPRSLSSILAGLQRHIENVSPADTALRIHSNEKDFKPLHTLLDNLYKDLHRQGIGTDRIQAEIITVEEAMGCWSNWH